MTATYTANVALAKAQRRLLDFDPDSSSAALVTLNPSASEKCLPIALFRRFVFGVFRSVGTGALSAFKVIAATDAAGAGSTDVVAHALGSVPDAVGDYVWLEVDVEQIREVLAAATHVGVSLTLATSTDECVVYAEASEPYYGPTNGLTADRIS